jgi:hypothetical protein
VYQVRGKLDPDYGWTDHRKKDFDVMRSDLFEKRVLYTAPQAECAPREAQPIYQVLNVVDDTWSDTDWMDFQSASVEKRIVCLAAPTPERAQPVGPRTTLNYDGTFDTTCAHCGGNGCFACLKSAAPTPERADADTAGAHIASVYEDKDGMKYVQFDIEDAEDIPIGTKLYPGTRTLTRHEVEEIAGYVEDECRACSGMTSLYVAAEAAVEETLMRLSLPVPSDEYFDAVDTETDAMLKPAAGASERADADTAGANPGWLHVDEVKALCRDFSSRTGNVYIKDVESALDGLAALPSADPTYPASERADAGKDAALTDEQKKAIAQDVHVTCSCIPGATFYNAAEMAIDAILAANKGSQNGR